MPLYLQMKRTEMRKEMFILFTYEFHSAGGVFEGGDRVFIFHTFLRNSFKHGNKNETFTEFFSVNSLRCLKAHEGVVQIILTNN